MHTIRYGTGLMYTITLNIYLSVPLPTGKNKVPVKIHTMIPQCFHGNK